MSTPSDDRPWYREPLVWMLILIPASAVIGGFVTLGLAISTYDGLVVDDYYQRGKAINRVLARDQAAEKYGLSGVLEFNATGNTIELRITARSVLRIPEHLEIDFLHATRAGLDKVFVLPRDSDGAYRAPRPVLPAGRWNVQLSAQDWRLTGSVDMPGARKIYLRPAGVK
jgi:uncharacterized protein